MNIHHRRQAALAAVLWVAVVTVGCGSSSAGGTTPTTDQDTVSVSDGAVADATTDAENAEDAGSTANDTADNAEDSAQDAGGIAEDAGATDTSDDGGAADTKGGCPQPCTADQVCKDGKCEDIPKKCGGSCATGTYCDVNANGGKGICVKSACTLPSKWSADTHKLSMFQVAQSAQGCDLTGDKKPNNVLGNILKLYPAVNTELAKSINDGIFNLLLEAQDFATDGTKFEIVGLLGDVDSSNSSCSMTSPWANCKFTVDNDNYSNGPAGIDCPPRVLFTPATLKSGFLEAGDGTIGSKVIITLPTIVPLDIVLRQVSLQGYPKLDGDKWLETKLGKLCGVITQKDFNTAIDSVPEDAWKTLNLTKEQVKLIINATLKPDIDTNGDNFPDAISVAMLFETVPAQITKLTF